MFHFNDFYGSTMIYTESCLTINVGEVLNLADVSNSYKLCLVPK